MENNKGLSLPSQPQIELVVDVSIVATPSQQGLQGTVERLLSPNFTRFHGTSGLISHTAAKPDCGRHLKSLATTHMQFIASSHLTLHCLCSSVVIGLVHISLTFSHLCAKVFVSFWNDEGWVLAPYSVNYVLAPRLVADTSHRDGGDIGSGFLYILICLSLKGFASRHNIGMAGSSRRIMIVSEIGAMSGSTVWGKGIMGVLYVKAVHKSYWIGFYWYWLREPNFWYDCASESHSWISTKRAK